MDTVVDDLHYLELMQLAARIKARKISPLEVTRAQLDRIAALDGELGSYVHVMAEAAMAQAEAAQCRNHGRPVSRAAARRSDWAEGSVLDEGRPDGRRHRRPSGITGPMQTQAWCTA